MSGLKQVLFRKGIKQRPKSFLFPSATTFMKHAISMESHHEEAVVHPINTGYKCVTNRSYSYYGKMSP